MLLQESLINEDVKDLAKIYGEQLINYLNELKKNSLNDLSKEFNNKIVESIDFGISGNLLYLLELYKELNDSSYLIAVDEWIEILLVFVKNNPSNSYSLYKGRGGFIYLLIQRYSIKQDDYLLKEALHVIRPANQWYLESDYTTDYLYDGRAGTLLILVNLYQLSKESFLLEYIDGFIKKMISNSKVTRNGIFWRAEYSYDTKPACSFAFGTAGIKYVFQQLYDLSNDRLLKFMIDGIDLYSQKCWIENYNNWGDFSNELLDYKELEDLRKAYTSDDSHIFDPKDSWSWAYGTIGILGKFEAPISDGYLLENIFRDKLSNFESVPIALFDGLAGLGLYVNGFIDHSKFITWKFWELRSYILNRAKVIDSCFELFRGNIGGVYFLLKSTSTSAKTNVLNYVLPVTSEKLNLSLNFLDNLKKCLLKEYPRTVSLINFSASNLLVKFLIDNMKADCITLLYEFANFINVHIKSLIVESIYERILDVFSLESQKLSLLYAETRVGPQIYLDSLIFQSQILEVLNKSDEWLLSQSIYINDSVKVIKTGWDWGFFKDHIPMNAGLVKEKEISNLKDEPQKFSYFLQIFGEEKVSEFPLTPDFDLIMSFLSKPMSIKKLIQNVKSYLITLPEAKWKRFATPQLNHKDILTIDDFLIDIEWIVLKMIKPFIYRNILTVC